VTGLPACFRRGAGGFLQSVQELVPQEGVIQSGNPVPVIARQIAEAGQEFSGDFHGGNQLA
jgi:hypothetical protein